MNEETKEMKIREIANEIIELFEDLLEQKGIDIPCDSRAEQIERFANDDSARIYGTEYFSLENDIIEVLKRAFEIDEE